MRKILFGITILAGLCSCDMFKLDNMEGPNAQVYGSFIDKATGETMPVEQISVVAQEQGWDSVADQGWALKFDGTYRNNRVFAGDYKIDFKNLPCYQLPEEERAFKLKRGENRLDFEVTPFCRIRDLKLSYTDGKIQAAFKVEAGDATQDIGLQKVIFCLNTTMFVTSQSMNMVTRDPGSSQSDVECGDFEYVLTIDPKDEKNAEAFKYERELFVRVGAMMNKTVNSKNVYNFTPIYKVSKDFSTFTEVKF